MTRSTAGSGRRQTARFHIAASGVVSIILSGARPCRLFANCLASDVDVERSWRHEMAFQAVAAIHAA